MSADNIVICPKCRKRFRDIPENEIRTDLREWVDVGIDSEGTLLIRYRCECYKCGFEWRYEETVRADLGDADG